jgi:hypothetical protein
MGEILVYVSSFHTKEIGKFGLAEANSEDALAIGATYG